MVFETERHGLPPGSVGFAQSPQALVLDDRVRVYFSTRSQDRAGGKFRSHVAYVDMSPDLREVLEVSQRPVVPLGELGAFDEHGIFPMHVVRHSGRIWGYTSGWSRRVSVSVETGIGLTTSDDDGRTFRRVGPGPVLGKSLHEPYLVGDPFVLRWGDSLHMWYIFGVRWAVLEEGAPPDRVYKVGHAVSADGVSWKTDGGRAIIADRLHADESQALPTVIEIDGRLHMYFCYRESADFRTGRGRGYRLGYAVSDNGASWWRRDEDAGIGLSAEGWDSEMMCYPHLVRSDGREYLLYNGNAFGRHGFGAAVRE